jgi:hypothetical protein
MKFEINNRGNSLLMVLMASAITAIITLVIFQLIETSRKAQGTNEISFANLELMRNIEANLANTTKHVCESTFFPLGALTNFSRDAGGTPLDVTSIVTGGTTPSEVLFQTTGKDNTGNLIIDKMQLIKFQDNGAEDPYNGFGIFEITIKKAHKDKSLGSEYLRPRQIVLRMQLWASGTDQSKTRFCTPASTSSDSVWSVNGDGKIYYDGGNVGIGTSTPGRALQVMGEIEIGKDVTTGSGGNMFVTGKTTSTVYYHSSDLTLKEDFRKINGLDLIRRLRGVMFKWKSSGNEDLGVIAQEVEKVIPYIVATDANSKLKTVNYDSLIAVLIESVKSLDKKYDEQNSRIKAIETELKSIQR